MEKCGHLYIIKSNVFKLLLNISLLYQNVVGVVEHWITIIKDENNKIYYFDSFRMSPANFPKAAEVLEFCESLKFDDW